MNLRSFIQIGLVAVCLALGMSGCATSGVPDLERNGVYKKEPVLFDATISQVKQATLEAVAALGCRKLAETDIYYKGQLPRGEVVEVFLKPGGADKKTSAWVKTRKTYVGGAWQRDREAEVIQELKRAVMLVVRQGS